MATTANGLPYPVGTDKVVNGDDAIKALADALQARGGGFSWVAAKVSVTTSSTGIAIVSFPVPFASPPYAIQVGEWTYGNVFVIVDSNQGGGSNASAFYVRVTRPDGSLVGSAPILLSYIAVGVLA
jgi:hypothetical protein